MNIQANREEESEIKEFEDGNMRKVLVVLNVSGLNFNEKKVLITDKLKEVYGEIPEEIKITRVTTRPDNYNPDGWRILVECNWLKRQRFHDDKGIYRFGTLLKSINNFILNKTNKRLLK